jgi:hypothetical protein
MLDDVERWAFLVQPAREDPLPASSRLLDIELHEGAGEPLIFPRRGRVAGAQAHHGVAEADGLSRLERDVAHDSVALVEQPKHGDPLCHRSDSGDRLDRLWRVDRHGIRAIGGLGGIVIPAAAGEHDQKDRCCEAPGQDYSGFQA